MSADYSDFMFSIGYRIAQMGTLENNGYSCKSWHSERLSCICLCTYMLCPYLPVKFTVDESYGASISGGPLSESYILNQFHLHWGSQRDQGSEHTIDGHRFDNSHSILFLADLCHLNLCTLSAMMENYTWSTTSQPMTTSLLQSQITKQILWLLLESSWGRQMFGINGKVAETQNQSLISRMRHWDCRGTGKGQWRPNWIWRLYLTN